MLNNKLSLKHSMSVALFLIGLCANAMASDSTENANNKKNYSMDEACDYAPSTDSCLSSVEYNGECRPVDMGRILVVAPFDTKKGSGHVWSINDRSLPAGAVQSHEEGVYEISETDLQGNSASRVIILKNPSRMDSETKSRILFQKDLCILKSILP